MRALARRARDLAVGLVIASAFFAALEGILRAVGFEYHPGGPLVIWNSSFDEGIRRAEGLYRFHPYWFWELRPGAEVTECEGERINGSGYRGLERPRTPSGRGRRIATLGDSSTFGMGVCWKEAYPAVLERLLPDTEVLNFGVVGFTAFQGEQLLAGRALAYHPTVVLAAFGAVDEQFPAHPDVDAKYAITSRTSPLVAVLHDRLHPLRSFELLERGFGAVAEPPVAERRAALLNYDAWRLGTPYVPNQSLPSFERSLERIVALARGVGAKVALVAPPRRRVVEQRWPVVEEYSRAVAATASRVGVPCWDARAEIRAYQNADRLFFRDDFHPNREGHALYAAFLARKIRNLETRDESTAAVDQPACERIQNSTP